MIELDYSIHKTKILNLGKFEIPNPQYGDFKLNVMPFEHSTNVVLPEGFKLWENSLNNIMKLIPVVEGAKTHYITIDSKWFAQPETQRREGVHIDGNFCIDPTFKGRVHGGVRTWGGARCEPVKEGDPANIRWVAITPWVTEWPLKIPVGKYVTDKKGGIFTVSTLFGCRGWDGDIEGEVLSEGEWRGSFFGVNEIKFNPNELYFMTSNTPHESVLIQGGRRTFMRVTLNHEYPTDLILDTFK